MAKWVEIAVTALLGFGALYYANNLGRRTRAELETKVAEKRLPAYEALWQETKVVSPMREAPLRDDELSKLFDDLTDWYYDGGNGMLLTQDSRNIYLKAKRNLTCPIDEVVPTLPAGAAEDRKAARRRAVIDQFSLLRTSMRADLAIFTQPYDQALSGADEAFLAACRVDLTRRPWRDAKRGASTRRDG